MPKYSVQMIYCDIVTPEICNNVIISVTPINKKEKERKTKPTYCVHAVYKKPTSDRKIHADSK